MLTMQQALIDAGAVVSHENTYVIGRAQYCLTLVQKKECWAAELHINDIIASNGRLCFAQENDIRQALTGMYQEKRLLAIIDGDYILLKPDSNLFWNKEDDVVPIIAMKKDHVYCTICAPYFPFRTYVLKKIPANNAEWQELLQWPEAFEPEISYIVGDRRYADCITVNVNSPMVDIYYAIGEGRINARNSFGAIIVIKSCWKKQKTVGRLLGHSHDVSFYYVHPAVACRPRTKLYNFLAYKDGKFATPLCEIKYDKKYNTEDIISAMMAQPLDYFGTSGKIKQPAECSICLDAEGHYACDRCFNQYACRQCGRLDKCPLCRHSF